VSFHGDNFEIIISPKIAQQVRGLHRRAAREGVGRAFVTTFQTLVFRLRSAPDDFGEPMYRLPALRMQIRCAVVPPLIVHFGVCEDRPTVYVKGVDSLTE
jgi:hypothetical protein